LILRESLTGRQGHHKAQGSYASHYESHIIVLKPQKYYLNQIGTPSLVKGKVVAPFYSVCETTNPPFRE